MVRNEIQQERRLAWDRAALSLTSDAEGLHDPQAAFARTTFLEVLRSDGNQIIFGRRGTGKTHLLTCLQAELKTRSQTEGTLPIYINGETLRQQANVLASEPQAVALSLYVALMSKLAAELNNEVQAGITPDWWDRYTNGPQSRQARRARALAGALTEVLREGEVRVLPEGKASVEAKTVDEFLRGAGVRTQLSADVSGAAPADPRKIGLKLGAQAEAKRRRVLTETATVQPKADVVLPYSQVATQFASLLDLLRPSGNKPARLVLLFDEWSAVDDNMQVQPLLAEMVKRTLVAMQRATLKIACIPGRTQLVTPVSRDSPSPIGLEMGDDITADVDLDLPPFIGIDTDQLLAFFLTLLKKHMEIQMPWAKEVAFDEFISYTCDEVFVSSTVFAELCQASACVPRDFLNLFRIATARQRDADTDKIDLTHIRAAALSLYENKLSNFGGPGSEAIVLLETIFKTVVAPRSARATSSC